MKSETPELPTKQSSYWLDASSVLDLPALTEKITCDVVIIGGGIAGLTAAYKLKQAGMKVIVLEKNTIASGTTGGTTGKVTTQHGLIYAELIQQFGRPLALQYASLSQQAFNDIDNLIKTEKIGCDWHPTDNFVYTTEKQREATLQKEASVAAELGLPATYETSSALPFPVVGMVKFANQAYFNAAKYTRSLARLVDGGGSHVFEHSEAKGIHEGRPCIVETKNGKVNAKYLIVATKVPAAPLVGRLTYASDEYPTNSYIVAGQYVGDLQGMYISPDKSHYSLLPVDTAAGRLLLVGGEGHLPGIKRSTPQYRKLAAYAREHFGVASITYQWRAMDYLAYDSLPLIGKLYPWSKQAYMIGGFKKWGLNLSMVAANVITEAIVGNNEKNMAPFSPHRLTAMASIPKAVVKYFQ